GAQMTTKTAKAGGEALLSTTIAREVAKRVVAQEVMVERLLVGLLTGGHILLEGVPGLAKTLAVRTVAESLRISFSRIQFTPDLLPADVIGTMVFDQRSQEFYAKKGPLFANLVLADEINRAPAKVQSAPIEVQRVAEADDILAARSAIAELFMDQKVVDYIVDVVRGTREPQAVGLPELKPLIAFGASPRASIYLAQAARAHAYLRGRSYVVPEDVKAMAFDVLRHRVLLTFEAEAEDMDSDRVIA